MSMSEPVEYDAIAIGTGTAMNIVDGLLHHNPDMKVAVIDKDEPGGICLTRGCIPSKILIHSADVLRIVEDAHRFGIDVEIRKVDYERVMRRMRSLIDPEIEMIRRGLSQHPNIDYYQEVAEFVAPYTLKVGDKLIKSNLILLCSGSKPYIPPIEGLEEVGYHTNRTIFHLFERPGSLAIIGGGYMAAEFGHFFSAMGTRVTIIGRNPQFLPQEEPEVSRLAKRELGRFVDIYTNHEVVRARKTPDGKKELIAINRETGEEVSFVADEILVAAGRAPNTDILHPERAGIETDEQGWIKVNEYLEASQPGVWVCGDANGKYLFKHVANYESKVIFYNIMGHKVKMSYHAVPHAVFTYPEIASVGMREAEAIERLGKDRVLIGFHRYEDTAKGEAMGVKDYFVKVIVDGESGVIVGAHIIGPHASILIQEIVTLMYSRDPTYMAISTGMHIHPALSEVVERAFWHLMPVDHYHHMLEHHLGL